MTREKIEELKGLAASMGLYDDKNPCKRAVILGKAIEALEQEPRKDEVILTNKEYRELISNEYDNGYCKGYEVALEEQENTLDKIKAEIEQLKLHKAQFLTNDNKVCIDSQEVLDVIDKYKGESEG